MKLKKCEKCLEELKLVIPYTSLDWYKCIKCNRDIVIMKK